METVFIRYAKGGETAMNVRDIEIAKIKQLENIRLRISEKDVHTLMSSIKQDGLLEPIGVSTTTGSKDEYIVKYGNRRLEACRKLGWKTIPAVVTGTVQLKDFIIQNTLENVERQDISESELGRIFVMLKNDYDMTDSEIGSRFGMPTGRVKRVINIFIHIPEEYRDKIKYGLVGRKRGNIPATSANAIVSMRRRYGLTKDNIAKLLDVSRQDGFNIGNLEVVASLLARSYNVDEAIKIANKYIVTSVKVPILKDEIKAKKRKYKKPLNRILNEILSGELKDTFNIPKWKK